MILTKLQFALFILGLILPSLYQRLHYILNKNSFFHTELRNRSGLNIHHGHWGLVFAFISMFLLVFGFRNIFSIALAGYGWGLMLDEVIPMLKMPSPTDRKFELEVYEKSLKGTITLIACIIVISLLTFFTLS